MSYIIPVAQNIYLTLKYIVINKIKRLIESVWDIKNELPFLKYLSLRTEHKNKIRISVL